MFVSAGVCGLEVPLMIDRDRASARYHHPLLLYVIQNKEKIAVTIGREPKVYGNKGNCIDICLLECIREFICSNLKLLQEMSKGDMEEAEFERRLIKGSMGKKIILTEEQFESIRERNWKQALKRFSSIKKDVLDACYVYYKTRMHPIFWTGDREIFETLKESETLTKTPVQSIKSGLQNKYGLNDDMIQISKAANDVEIFILVGNIGDNVEELISDMDKFGFFLSRRIDGSNNFSALRFEPKKQKTVIFNRESSSFLFHLTPTRNLNKIQKEGLIPKSENKKFKYPPRVYFIRGDVPEYRFKDVVEALEGVKEEKDDDYSILTIDRRLLPAEVKFFYDPNFNNCIYTSSRIPPRAIIKVENYVKKDLHNR